MHESFLHYVWQLQYFTKQNLISSQGEPIHIFNPGFLNTHAGPDFSNAKIAIGDVQWIGTVEIHIYSSDWLVHKHHVDGAYENVILHVVWDNDKPVKRKDGTWLPTLELKNRVDDNLILKYKRLMNSPEEIPCMAAFASVPDVEKFSMIDKSVTTRLEAKANEVMKMHERNNHDWAETCYQTIGKNFGFKVNADPFLQLTQSLPYKILLKHSDRLDQLEALLFGQAGFLDDICDDEYSKQLKKEYEFLSTKYDLVKWKLKKSQWRFLRLRPANFPTIRIAQLATLLFHQKNIFSKLLESSYQGLIEIFTIHQSSYWRTHYAFHTGETKEVPPFGEMSRDLVIINSVVPLLVAYGRMQGEQEWIDRAVSILQEIPPETNAITKRWASIGQKASSAFDSQGLIELYNSFCLKKRCLDCNIGASIMKSM